MGQSKPQTGCTQYKRLLENFRGTTSPFKNKCYEGPQTRTEKGEYDKFLDGCSADNGNAERAQDSDCQGNQPLGRPGINDQQGVCYEACSIALISF